MIEPINRIVIKLGTGILTKDVGQIDPLQIARICQQIAEARKRGIEVILVSSGAVGMGMGVLGIEHRPQTLAKQQACAAIGQSRLIQAWQDGLEPYGHLVAQLLLTHEGLKFRDRYVNAKETIEQVLSYGAIPIINENDTISTYEIQFGNNDLLSALVASLCEADKLFVLSTAPGLIDMQGTGEIIPVVEEITPEIAAMAQDTNSPTAVGGMISKLEATRLATECGCETYIVHGCEENVVPRLLDGEQIGTCFRAVSDPMSAKKRWLAFFQRPTGSLIIDNGAKEALQLRGRSLLAPGILKVEGVFDRGNVLDIVDTEGHVIARGQSNFSSSEIDEIISDSEMEIDDLHPGRVRSEIVHRDHMALL